MFPLSTRSWVKGLMSDVAKPYVERHKDRKIITSHGEATGGGSSCCSPLQLLPSPTECSVRGQTNKT